MTKIDQKMYQIFANKKLSFGCLVCGYKRSGNLACNPSYVESCEEGLFIHEDGNIFGIAKGDGTDFKILGHEPQLHDIYKICSKKAIIAQLGDISNNEPVFRFSYFEGLKRKIKKIEYKPTISLMSQSDEVKQQLINLFS